MEYPTLFVDEMVKGPFKKLHHQHQFKIIDSQTEMTDVFEFQAAAGLLGRLVEKIFLKKYMLKLIEGRNEIIKFQAEIMYAKNDCMFNLNKKPRNKFRV